MINFNSSTYFNSLLKKHLFQFHRYHDPSNPFNNPNKNFIKNYKIPISINPNSSKNICRNFIETYDQKLLQNSSILKRNRRALEYRISLTDIFIEHHFDGFDRSMNTYQFSSFPTCVCMQRARICACIRVCARRVRNEIA